MLLFLAAAVTAFDCPDPFVAHGDSCYVFASGPSTKTAAAAVCEEHGAMIACPLTKAEGRLPRDRGDTPPAGLLDWRERRASGGHVEISVRHGDVQLGRLLVPGRAQRWRRWHRLGRLRAHRGQERPWQWQLPTRQMGRFPLRHAAGQ